MNHADFNREPDYTALRAFIGFWERLILAGLCVSASVCSRWCKKSIRLWLQSVSLLAREPEFADFRGSGMGRLGMVQCFRLNWLASILTPKSMCFWSD